MKRISAERKEAVIKKMLPPLSMSVNELMEIEGISRTTLYVWKASLFSDGEEMPNLERDAPHYLSAEAKHTSNGPVFTTDRGRPAFGLLKMDDYYRIANKECQPFRALI